MEYSTGSEKTVMVGWMGKGGSGKLGGTGGNSPDHIAQYDVITSYEVMTSSHAYDVIKCTFLVENHQYSGHIDFSKNFFISFFIENHKCHSKFNFKGTGSRELRWVLIYTN